MPEEEGANETEVRLVGAKLRSYMAKWSPLLGLSNWEIDVEVHPTRSEESEYIDFEVKSDWRYLHGGLRAYAPAIMELDEREIETSFVHELLHCVLSEMRPSKREERDLLADHEERVATILSRALIKAQEFGNARNN